MADAGELFRGLSDAVVDMDEDAVVALANDVVSGGHDAYDAIDKGLADGMERAGQLFEEQEYFVPELIVCADAMYAGLDILKPHIKQSGEGKKHTVIIGVIEGDTHDIGKNLVKIMLETAGFNVIDLGRDILPSDFVDAAVRENADVIAISTLMTTTMSGMGEVIEVLKQRGIRENHKVIVGGGPISQGFADKIGADGYSVNAAEAVRLVRGILA
ncbi:MAG: corrinoid protein [Oscillospiraceae bacterium]|jgi:corrinoid protein of di/trimethylamine methyltransferase|nr:corrinoid protein [Oscillospiraceae bacterium]